MGRRDSNDKRWKEVKEKVFDRDKGCRLCRILNPVEYLLLKKNAGVQLEKIDAAHFRPVGQFPELCYSSADICSLNHYSHSMLDSFKDPIDGHNITAEEVEKWWIRILKGDPLQYKFLLNKGIIKE